MTDTLNHKAGYVSILGNPNVGKSSFMNACMGDKLSIITSKAQTTRHRILGMINSDSYQIVLSDTPGIIKPSYELQTNMMNFVHGALEDSDVILYMVEVGQKEVKNDYLFSKLLAVKEVPIIVLINKIDVSDEEKLNETSEYWKTIFPTAIFFPISAISKFGIDQVLESIVSFLPQHPPFFPKDQLTDKSERFIVNETIREQILMFYKKEIPYAVEVVTEEFFEEEAIIRIRSVVMVERESQKGILIGHKGLAIKKVGTRARQKLETFFSKKIHIEIRVKVKKDWRSDKNMLQRFGYQTKN